MSAKENVLFSLTTEMTPKIDEGEVAFSLRSRDYKDPPCVVIEQEQEDDPTGISQNKSCQE